MIPLFLVVLLVVAGLLLGWSLRLVATLIAGLWGFAVLVQVFAPGGAALRGIVGGDLRGWLALGVLGAVVVGYRAGFLRLTAGKPAQTVARAGKFTASELDRYARHIMLREIGGPGQGDLRDAKVLVIGAGGLGSPALMYLAASGVGVIGVVDDDVVEASNLQRQIIHTDARIGMPKVQSALVAMKALNPFIEARSYNRRLTDDIAEDLFADYDLILDGSDNFDTRYLVNAAAVAAGKPLISAAITQWEGQIGVFDPARGGPCYACVFPNRPAPGLVPSCAEAGVAAPLPGVLGAMMAMEAVKAITQAGEGLRGRLMIYDGLYGEVRVISVKRRADCAVCGGHA